MSGNPNTPKLNSRERTERPGRENLLQKNKPLLSSPELSAEKITHYEDHRHRQQFLSAVVLASSFFSFLSKARNLDFYNQSLWDIWSECYFTPWALNNAF